MKHEIIRLLLRAREALLTHDHHLHDRLIGDLKLAVDKLESMREVDPLAPISHAKDTKA